MRCLRFGSGVVAIIALLTGCFQIETTVRVNPDGSGTIEERMLMSQMVIAQMDEMAKSFGGPGDKSEPFTLYDPKKLKAQAAGMGQGVTFVSAEKVREKDYAGYRAIYSFTDINKIRLSRKSSATDPDPSAGNSEASGDSQYRFTFTPGPSARLVITSTNPKKPVAPSKEETSKKEADKEKQALTPAQEQEAMKMFKGLRFSMKVEVNGTVKESNAVHRDGNRITLFDFDLDRIGADAGKLMQLKQIDPASLEDAKKILKDFPGFKVDLNERLEIVFTR
jgi:hypothetical protein